MPRKKTGTRRMVMVVAIRDGPRKAGFEYKGIGLSISGSTGEDQGTIWGWVGRRITGSLVVRPFSRPVTKGHS